MIFPIPKKTVAGQKTTAIKKQITLFTEDALFDKATRALSLFLPFCKVLRGDGNAIVKAIKTESLAAMPEGYTLDAKDGKVNIKYFTYSGLRNALATFSLLVECKGNSFMLPDIFIEDSPEASHRGVMLDLARGTVPMERLIADIVLIAKAKMNVLHLHLADSKGSAVELSSLPEEMHIENRYTKSDVKTLVELCDSLGLEIIPEYDIPAHSRKLISVFPELCCDIESGVPHTWTACVGTEKLYEICEGVIKELTEMFPHGRYFHIGGDEIEFTDLTGSGYRLCHWAECRKCKQKMAKEGLRDRQELYYYFANRMNEYVKSLGKQTVMWSDQIDCTRPRGLSADILMQFWRVAGHGRGPHEGCSMRGQLAMGYNLINSFYERTYIDLEEYMSVENLSGWRWDEEPECDAAQKNQIVGSEVCAWEYGNRKEYRHYDHSLPSAIILIADKLWGGNKANYETEEVGKLLTRAVLGEATPADFNVFSAIGSVYPPRALNAPDTEDILSYPDKVRLNKEELCRVIDILSDESLYLNGDLLRARIYRKCAEYSLANTIESSHL